MDKRKQKQKAFEEAHFVEDVADNSLESDEVLLTAKEENELYTYNTWLLLREYTRAAGLSHILAIPPRCLESWIKDLP